VVDPVLWVGSVARPGADALVVLDGAGMVFEHAGLAQFGRNELVPDRARRLERLLTFVKRLRHCRDEFVRHILMREERVVISKDQGVIIYAGNVIAFGGP